MAKKLNSVIERLEQARAELEERITIERLHERQVAKLVAFIDSHELLTKADLRKAATSMKHDAVRRGAIDVGKLKHGLKGNGKGRRWGPPPPELAAKLSAARENKGLTQKALAQRIGVHLSMVKRWENGLAAHGPQSQATRDKLVKALGLSPQVFAPPPGH